MLTSPNTIWPHLLDPIHVETGSNTAAFAPVFFILRLPRLTEGSARIRTKAFRIKNIKISQEEQKFC